MSRPLRQCLLLGVALLGLAAGACARKNAVRPKIPPDTFLFVQGKISPVNHRIHLYWYGTDPDGEVVGFRYRWRYLGGPADPPWNSIPCAKPGVCTDSIFTVFTGDSLYVSPIFEIAAIDNDGQVDPTPASQQFVLGNIPPTVTITSSLSLSDTTYASLTLNWSVYDPDGGGPGLHYRVWLDGNRVNYDSTAEQTLTISSDRFLQGGTYQSGPRTAYVQAVDDGGSEGPVASTSWYVRAPAAVMRNNRGRLLLIDDIPSSGSSNATFDAFYLNALSPLPAGSWSVLRPQFNPNIFRSARDFAQTLRQFEAVLWYRGLETNVPPLLVSYQDSLGAWLDNGGRLYLDGLFLVEGYKTSGALGRDFMIRHLGSDFLFRSFSTTLGDSTDGWSNVGGARTGSLLRSSVYRDTVRTLVGAPSNGSNETGIRGFGVRDTSYVALWAMDGQLVPPNAGFELPVGVTVSQPNGGRIVLISLPLRAGAAAPAGRILGRILFDPPPNGLLPP